jgi:Tfp pilus assembly protein PilE
MKISKSLMVVAFMFLGVLTTMQYSSWQEDIDEESDVNTQQAMNDLIQDGQMESFLQEIQNAGANINGIKIERDQTLLQMLARAGDFRLVQKCLEMGADIDAQDDMGYTALHDAILGGSLKTVKILIDAHADSTKKDTRGETALDYCRVYPFIDEEIRNYLRSSQWIHQDLVQHQLPMEEYPESLIV